MAYEPMPWTITPMIGFFKRSPSDFGTQFPGNAGAFGGEEGGGFLDVTSGWDKVYG